MQIGTLIPQVFYDVIGRVVPGSALLIVAFCVFQDSPNESLVFLFKYSGISGTLLFLAALLLSYLLGVLLGAFGFAIGDCEWKHWNTSKLTIEKPDSSDPCKGDKGIAYIYDSIHYYAPAVGARLAKLSAERHMCRVLIVGCLFIGIGHAIYNRADCNSSEYPLIILGLFVWLLGSVFFYLHIGIRQRRALLNNWDLIQQKIADAKGSDATTETESNEST